MLSGGLIIPAVRMMRTLISVGKTGKSYTCLPFLIVIFMKPSGAGLWPIRLLIFLIFPA